MGHLAARMEAVVRTKYPTIPFTPDEKQRERDLRELGQAFQKVMDSRSNNTALKGGTALRFQMGLPRPSTDLDFEGDQRINVRRAVKKAVELAFGRGTYRIGWNWLKRGGVQLQPKRRHDRKLKSKVDYQKMGTFVDMPPMVPMTKVKRQDGINIYNERELVHKKLGTMIGPGRTRQRARDIYDTGWLVNERPHLISRENDRLLKEWAGKLTRGDIETLEAKLKRNELTARVDAKTVVAMLKTGIQRLHEEPARLSVAKSDRRNDNGNGNGDDGGDPPKKPKRTAGPEGPGNDAHLARTEGAKASAPLPGGTQYRGNNEPEPVRGENEPAGGVAPEHRGKEHTRTEPSR